MTYKICTENLYAVRLYRQGVRYVNSCLPSVLRLLERQTLVTTRARYISAMV